MKMLVIASLLWLTLVQAPGKQPGQSGLEILSLNSKIIDLTPSRLSTTPPDNATRPGRSETLPRGTIETDAEKVDHNLDQRMADMSVLANKRNEPPPSGRQKLVSKAYESDAEIKNSSSKAARQFVVGLLASPDRQTTQDQNYLCELSLDAGETKHIKLISGYPAQKVITVSPTGVYSPPAGPSLKDIIINQVQFADGTVWSRPNWDSIVLSRLNPKRLHKGECTLISTVH